MESAGQLIVDPTKSHFVESEVGHPKRGFVIRSVMMTQEEIDCHTRRELWCGAEAPMVCVEVRSDSPLGLLNKFQVDLAVGVGAGGL